MILERQNMLNINQIERELSRYSDDDEIHDISKLVSYYQLCHSAVSEFGTKLENLDADYQVRHNHNPIHHIEIRMKDVSSLIEKIERKNLPVKFESIKDRIFDVGGIRVITNYIDDIYTVEENLLAQDDVVLLKRKDYIKNPKDSGYRSLHLVASVPVFQSDGVQVTPVEIQIRTIGMDMWASLEHKLRYKTEEPDEKVAQYSESLQDYADEINKIENNMQEIFHNL
ncbi:GTP pyrophosphokinase [Companilactobacillus nodensis]|uniref:RelA SpoT domain-containing protein n=1 Tax=Companilactobacillus nodensis DSM 19682 = JCM 14932 = NBRC 107160 TaxID=1423775 RepID=A0A0R1K8U1_9LACO|nr:GTP pyrophosphokinase [Companilactobacillus nodensis]KRK80061.1 RelA SpoT domain-containing protein [Companilactobacillus nodensis DSM 19682 = JCM 14932 = NBRC 107160]